MEMLYIVNERRKITKKIKFLVLILLAIGMCTGCEECVESHQEDSKCSGCNYVRIGEALHCIPYYYNCKKAVCDKWEGE